MINDFDQLTALLKGREQRIRIVIANPADAHTVQASVRMYMEGIADLVLVGRFNEADYAEAVASREGGITFVPMEDNSAVAAEVVRTIRSGEADVLMKGLINTDTLLHEVLRKDNGLMREGCILSHVAIMQLPQFERFIFFTDAAVIPEPTLEQRIGITHHVCDVMRKFGIESPRVALIHFTEKTSDKYPITLQYSNMKSLAEAGEWGDAVIDGPMDVGTALNEEFGRLKGISSPVCGSADALVFPCLEAGNTFYKSVSVVARARMAGMLVGTICPIVMPSRGDTAETKYNCLAMAALVCGAI